MIQALLFLFGLGSVGRVRNLGRLGRLGNLENLVIDANYSLNTYSYAACLKGTKRAKRHPCHLALTFDKFCCTRHSQGESQEGCTILYKFHLVCCSHLPNFARVQVRRRFGKMQTSLLFRSPCTNFVGKIERKSYGRCKVVIQGYSNLWYEQYHRQVS